ncbi:MAG: hypothetical protein HY553_14380 [Elusimicrobia bacterium]|nr:hypothetical protein [Elusimicrobiota bacterium]
MLRAAAVALFVVMPRAAWSNLRPDDEGLRPAASWASLRPEDDAVPERYGRSPASPAPMARTRKGPGREDTTPALLQPAKLRRRSFPVQKLPGPPQPKGVMAAPGPQAPGPPAPNAPAAIGEVIGLDYNGSIPPNAQFYPADTQAAVGVDEMVVVSNTEVRYLTKTGIELFRRRLTDWWDTVPGSFIADFNDGFAFDPKIVFDPRAGTAGRYFFVTLAGPATGFSQIMLAVSRSSNPSDGWHGSNVDYDGADRFWFDYPGLGISDDWLVVTGVRFERDDQPSNALYDGNCGIFGTSAACGTEMFRWTRSQIVNGNFGSMAATFFQGNPGDPNDNAGDSVLMPAVAYDGTGGGDVYIIQSGWVDDSAAGNDSRLIRTFRMPAAGPPLVDQGLTAVVNSTYVFPTGGVGYPSAPQQGTSNRIALGDDRILSAVLRNSKLWATHTVGFPAGPPHASPSQTQVAWYSFNLDGTLRQDGLIRDTTPSTNFYWFPSLAVDEFENVAIGFNGSGTSQFVSAYYTGCYRGGTTCAIQSELLYEAGKNIYNVLVGGVNRWGDFSATVPDPADPGVFWTIQEITASTANQYELRMAKFSLFPSPATEVPGFTFGISGTPTPGGQQAQITWTAHADATKYEVLQGVATCGTVQQTIAYTGTLSFTAGSLDPNTTIALCARPVNPNGSGPLQSPVPSTTTVAAQVTGLSLGRTATSITANFTPPNAAYASAYQAEAYADGTCDGTPDAVVVVANPAVTFVDIPGLQPQTNYCVRVGARNSRGAINYGSPSQEANITTDTNLLPPVALPPTNVGETSIRVNWNTGGNPVGTLYSATAAVTPDFSGAIITSTTYNLFATFSGLTPNTTYHFKVAPTSAPAKFTDLATVATFAQAPTAFTFKAGDPTTSSSTLLFSKGANPNPGTTYYLELDADDTFDDPITFDLCSTSIACLDIGITGLPSNTTIFHRIRARNHDGTLTAPALLTGATLPLAPLAPQYISVTFTSATVSWTSPGGTRQGWRLEAGSGAGNFTPPIPAVSIFDTAVTRVGLEGLDHDTSYIFRVGSIGVDNRINFTNFTSTKTPLAIFSTNTVRSTGTHISFTPTYAAQIPNVTLYVPPGALPVGTVVRVDSNVQYIVGPQRSNQGKILGLGPSVAVDIRAAGGLQPDPGLPTALTFTYNPAGLPAGRNPADLHICWFDPAAQVWDILPSRVDLAANTVTAQLPHFSLISPYFDTPGTDLGGVEIFPVPWEPGTGTLFDAGGITFTNMPPSADVRIYTLRGELVWEGPATLTGFLFWDGKTRFGGKVGSGVYLVNIVSGGQRLLRRLVISR